MSSYPPGVTGNEPQIAGYPERTETVECDATAEVLFRHEVREVIYEARINGHDLSWVKDQIDNVLYVAELDCEWSGEVDGQVDGYDFIWTCPRCGTENVEDGMYEPDPDQERDW